MPSKRLLAAVAALASLAFGAPGHAQDAPPAPADTETSAQAEPVAPSPAQAESRGLPARPLPYSQIARPQRPRASAPTPTPSPGTQTPAEVLPTAAPATAPARPRARLARGQPIPQAELGAFVDAYVRQAMARERIAGAVVSVVQGGQVVLSRGYGAASVSPFRPVDPGATLFRVGSISKTFTWLGLLSQVEAGQIRLDAPANLYLPEPLRIRDQGLSRPVRVRDLMDHSAGFEDRMLGHLFERSDERVRPLSQYLRQERPDRVRPPGAFASYSNYGAALAGQMMSYVAQKPFEDLIEQQILKPAGLAHTTFREPRAQRAGLPAPMDPALARNLSSGFALGPDGVPRPAGFEFIGQVAPAGSASSTAEDMARYMILLLQDGQLGQTRIYGALTARALQQPLLRTPPGMNGWNHGFMAYTLPGGFRAIGHDGATMNFHSRLLVSPDLGLGVFVAVNTNSGYPLPQGLANALVGAFYASPQAYPRPGSAELVREAGAYTGAFASTRRANGGLEKLFGLLIGSAHAMVTPEGYLITREQGMVRTWTPLGPLKDGVFVDAFGEERLFATLREGRAVALTGSLNAVRLERVAPWLAPATLGGMALLAILASIATLIGALVRNRRERRETPVQGRASLLQATQATLWLAGMILAGAWLAAARDAAGVMYGWPGAGLLVASACALVAAILGLVTLLLLPGVWRGGRRLESWGWGRKAAFSFTCLLYLAFSIVLAAWGGLSPWNG